MILVFNKLVYMFCLKNGTASYNDYYKTIFILCPEHIRKEYFYLHFNFLYATKPIILSHFISVDFGVVFASKIKEFIKSNLKAI